MSRMKGDARQRERAKRRKELNSGVATRRLSASIKFDPTPGAMFHGGRAGLAVGSYLTPPRERGEHRLERGLAALDLDGAFSHHASYVFFFDDPLLALAFANRNTKSDSLYEIEPEGDVEDDEDGHIGSYKCKRAKIVRRVRVPAPIVQKLRENLRHRGYHDAGADWGLLLNLLPAAA